MILSWRHCLKKPILNTALVIKYIYHILHIPTLLVKIWVHTNSTKIIFADWILHICSVSKFYEPSSKILWKHPLNITTLICWKSYLPSPVSPAQQPQHPMLLETDILCDKLQLGGLLSACTANASGRQCYFLGKAMPISTVWIISIVQT